MEFRLGWGSNRGGVVFFQFKFLTGVLLSFLGGGVVFKNGVAFKPIQYTFNPNQTGRGLPETPPSPGKASQTSV